jgi:hypothetical protein
VGQQAYNQQLNELNNIMPELYQMAYERYGQEGQEMLDMFNMYMGLSEQDHSRYQANLDNWYQEVGRLTDNANTAYERDYNDYLLGYNTALDEYTTDRSEAFTTDQNEKQWEREDQANAKSDLINLITATGYNPTDSELKAAGMSREQANGYTKAYTESKATIVDKGKSDDLAGWDNGKLTASQVKMLQEEMGVTVDGKWGDESFKAAGGMTADEALKAYQRGELGGVTGGLGNTRKDEIYDWIEGVLTNKNMSASFDPNKLINGSSFLTSDEERAYAREIISYLSTIK